MYDIECSACFTLFLLQAISSAVSQKVQEDAKAYVQEQLLRKATQKEAIVAMEEEMV